MKNLNLLKILNTISDPIYIADHTGKTLWLNDTSAAACGLPREELIGKDVSTLENEGIFNPSAIRLALDSGKTISSVQEMKNGRKHMITGHLIRGENREVQLILAHSHDITEVIRTNSKLEEAEALLRDYSIEIRKKNSHTPDNGKEMPFIGKSKAYQTLSDTVDKVAAVDTTVLIKGETGSGKNVIAQQIHQLSDRHDKPFIQINCGALPESLLESELFGYKKGAFTGASAQGKTGLAKAAHKGTLFFDEIGELPHSMQAKLLQLLQDKTYRPIGETETHATDVRIIVATNQNIKKMVEEGTFRKDLYYRLNVVSIDIPPLRERKEDILPILHHYLEKFKRKHNIQRSFTNDVIKLFQEYDWPGNVRELENLIEGVVITAQHTKITTEDLPVHLRKMKSGGDDSRYPLEEDSLNEILENMERKLIKDGYRKHGSTRKAAKALGMTQSALMRRIKKYGITLEGS